MLEAVLRKISSSDLLKCRPINRTFNEIASRIMRQRADISIRFSYDDGMFMQKIQHRDCEELLVNCCASYSKFSSKSLSELVACLKQSKHFPITSFILDHLDKFDHEDMKSFLTIWGQNILALNITLNDPINDVAILRYLLGVKAANLKIFEIHFQYLSFKAPSSIELFVDGNNFQLPKLQVLRVARSYRLYRGIIANILKAAINLSSFFYSNEQGYGQPSSYEKVDRNDLEMLASLNKLHCLKDLKICLSEDLIAFWTTKRIDLKLKSLALSFESSIWENDQTDQVKSSAAAILNQWLHSSKDTIQTLIVEPLGSLPGLNIPKLEKLQKLHLCGVYKRIGPIFIKMFPPLFEIADNFPNLKELGKKMNFLRSL